MIVFGVLVLVLAFLAFVAIRADKNPTDSYGRPQTSDRGVAISFIVGISIVYFIISGIWAGVYYGKDADVKNSAHVVQELEVQRAEISTVFYDVLSNEDFVQLMEASTPDDLKALRTNPKVSDFLLGRADRIMNINVRLFAERNRLLDEARRVCNYADNPMIPKIPFIGPDCDLGDLTSSFKEADTKESE